MEPGRAALEARYRELQTQLVTLRQQEDATFLFFLLGLPVGLLLAALLVVPIGELMGLRF